MSVEFLAVPLTRDSAAKLPVSARMPPVSVPLNKIPRAGSCAGSDNGALLTADQSATDCAGDSTDNRAFRFAVVMPVATPMRRGVRGRAQYQKHNNQEHRNDVLISNRLYHYHPPFTENER